jgi:hypothetical protein
MATADGLLTGLVGLSVSAYPRGASSGEGVRPVSRMVLSHAIAAAEGVSLGYVNKIIKADEARRVGGRE